MFDIESILKTKQEEVARTEDVQRPIKALYKLIVEEGSLCQSDLSKHGLTLRFKSMGFDANDRLTFKCELLKFEFYSICLSKKEISLAMNKKAYEVCFENEQGTKKIVLHGTAETALSQILKYLSTTMAPAIGSYIQSQLLKEQSI